MPALPIEMATNKNSINHGNHMPERGFKQAGIAPESRCKEQKSLMARKGATSFTTEGTDRTSGEAQKKVIKVSLSSI